MTLAITYNTPMGTCWKLVLKHSQQLVYDIETCQLAIHRRNSHFMCFEFALLDKNITMIFFFLVDGFGLTSFTAMHWATSPRSLHVWKLVYV